MTLGWKPNGTYYLFPFAAVRPGSRVVIYGFGNVGRCYGQQLIESGYAQLVCYVDRAWESYQDRFDPVYAPAFLTAHPESFDTVVIALANPAVRGAVQAWMLRQNIAPEKIVPASSRLLQTGFSCSYDAFTRLEENPMLFHTLFADFTRDGARSITCLSPLLDTLKEISREKAQQWAEALFRIGLNVKERILLYYILFQARVISPAQVKQYMAEVLALPASERMNRYAICLDSLTWIPFFLPETLYDDFYLDYRKFFSRITADFNLTLPTKELTYRPVMRRIAICTGFLGPIGLTGSDQNLRVFWANALYDLGYEVAVIDLGSFCYSEEDIREMLFVPSLRSPDSVQFQEENARVLHEGVKVYYRHEKHLSERLQNAIEDIINFNPDLLCDMTDEVFIQSYILKTRYPILCYPLRAKATGSYFHHYITNDKELCQRCNQRFRSVDAEQMIEMWQGTEIVNMSELPIYTRETFDFQRDDFLLITASQRLSETVHDELGKIISELLTRYKNMRWILVGDTPDLTLSQYKKLLDEKRIILWGWEESLPSLLRLCDVFLNPKGMGNGITIRWAMREGLPVAMLRDYCDTESSVGRENTIVGDYADMAVHIEKLYLDRDYYKQVASKMKERLGASSAKATAIKFAQACEKTWKAFHSK